MPKEGIARAPTLLRRLLFQARTECSRAACGFTQATQDEIEVEATVWTLTANSVDHEELADKASSSASPNNSNLGDRPAASSAFLVVSSSRLRRAARGHRPSAVGKERGGGT